MKKRRVGVLFGGKSSEHEVSLRSAASVIQYLDRECFEVVPIGITKQGRWLLHEVSRISYDASGGVVFQPDAKPLSFTLEGNDLRSWVDVVFPVVHGEYCEDGRLQALLDYMDVPYVGSGVLGSAIAMNKVTSKRIAEQLGCKVPCWLSFHYKQWISESDRVLADIVAHLTFPVFVKPVASGSSVGISKVNTPAGLGAAIADAFLIDTQIMVENGVRAQEIEVAVLENINDVNAPCTTLPGEVVPHHEFYTYAAKYLDPEGASFYLPARVSEAVAKRAQSQAVELFTALQCEGLSRVDFFYDQTSDSLYFNEINAIPGFTSISLYPRLWDMSGIPYVDLLTRLIDLAYARYAMHARSKQSRVELVAP